MGESINDGVITLRAEAGAPELTPAEMHPDAVQSLGELSVLPGIQEAFKAAQSGTVERKFFGSH